MIASPALQARLDMLDEDLSGVLAGLEKLATDLKDLGTAGLNQRGVRMLLASRVKIQQNKIKDMRTDPAEKPSADLWVQYGDLRLKGDQLYREFLEIVGGVAIRRREIDEKICLIAQELVRGAVDPPSLTILAMGESHVPNLSRLMRIRFSDRAVWTLPLTTHQFAHVLIEDFQDFKNFALQKAEAEVSRTHPELAPAETDSELRRKKAARNRFVEAATYRWEQLIADCIALYIVGPCYAGSAILFRFSPVADAAETDSLAPDIDRAYVCLEMLRRAGQNADLPYRQFIDWLQDLWARVLADAGNSALVAAPRMAELSGFVGDLCKMLDQNLPAAEYPIRDEPDSLDLGGWSIAMRWARGWSEQVKNNGARMEVPDGVGESSKVRDALNAAWLCRSKFKVADMPELTQVARSVCDKIIAEVYRPAAERSTGAVQGPSGSRAR